MIAYLASHTHLLFLSFIVQWYELQDQERCENILLSISAACIAMMNGNSPPGIVPEFCCLIESLGVLGVPQRKPLASKKLLNFIRLISPTSNLSESVTTKYEIIKKDIVYDSYCCWCVQISRVVFMASYD